MTGDEGDGVEEEPPRRSQGGEHDPGDRRPMARAALNWAELSVMALSRSSRGTSSVTYACHAGMLRPLAAAASVTRTSRRRHRVAAGEPDDPEDGGDTAWTIWVTISSRRRAWSSARDPAIGPTSTVGNMLRNAVIPSSESPPVSWAPGSDPRADARDECARPEERGKSRWRGCGRRREGPVPERLPARLRGRRPSRRPRVLRGSPGTIRLRGA